VSIINVTKMWSKTGGSLKSELLSQLDEVWSITEGYQVLCEIGDDINLVANAVDLPNIGDQHPTADPPAFVESLDPTPLGPIFWQVIVNYRGLPNESGVEVEWTDTTTTEPIDRDINGAAIVTANNEPVEGLSMDVADQIVIIRRKFIDINPAAIAVYRRATNSDTFLGWPPGTARLVGYSAKNRFTYGTPQQLWDVTARIQFRQPYANTTDAQAWYKRWRHEGLLERDSPGGLIGRAIDDLGQQASKPVLLKLDGTRELDPNNAVFIHTQVYTSLPLSGLGLL
jgi:hypothetical protein